MSSPEASKRNSTCVKHSSAERKQQTCRDSVVVRWRARDGAENARIQAEHRIVRLAQLATDDRVPPPDDFVIQPGRARDDGRIRAGDPSFIFSPLIFLSFDFNRLIDGRLHRLR
jgi:hypothetical protein